MKLKIFRLRKGAKLPVRAYPTDAGMDLFYCPSMTEPNPFSAYDISLGPGSGTLIPTGLKIGVPKGYMLEIKNKSGIATKQRLVVGACVIDSGYDGEIYVNLNNLGTSVRQIVPGQKIAQAVLVPIETCGIKEIDQDNVYGEETSRASGGFGSTGDF